MPNPWLLLILLVAVGAGEALFGRHEYQAGVDATEAVWQARAAAENAQAAAQIASAEALARKAEADSAVRVAAISTDYEKRLEDAKTRHDSDIAAARRGTIVLRDPAGSPAVCPGPGTTAEAPAAAGGPDAPATGRDLSPAASGFLLELADDADRLAGQLAACQAVISADRQ